MNIAKATQYQPSQTTPSTTVNPIYEYSEEKVAAAEHDFHHRRDHLWNVCAKYDFIDRYPPNAWEFFISSGHGIAWCNVFKAASSTWMYYFNILGKYSRPFARTNRLLCFILKWFVFLLQFRYKKIVIIAFAGGYDVQFLQRTKASPLELARKRFPRPSVAELNEALSSSLSFLIVREPFERLLSGYRNKLESRRNKYYKLMGDQIIRDFRKGNKRVSIILSCLPVEQCSIQTVANFYVVLFIPTAMPETAWTNLQRIYIIFNR